MRILAIRGENLASLALPFCVDLTAAPLDGIGLFAITGETGAGKSTILDALCLALYGEYPRIAVGRREDAPDPSGRSISASDPRAILRRGASHGYAEVDFIGQDGQGYRVRWECNRARGRADGRLQNEERVLLRLDDGSAVATGKTDVRRAVEVRTDLTFDQFRRTVLLAQGEFDAFLLAAESERADLLEKITGTEVYSQISRRVHEGAERHRHFVAGLEERRDGLGVLDPERREMLIAEQEDIKAQVSVKAAEHANLLALLDHADRIDTARRNALEAEIRLAEAQALSDAAEEDRARSSSLAAAETLRPLAQALDGAEEHLERVEIEDRAAAEGLQTARLSAEQAMSRLKEAEAADEASEETFKRFGPIWSEAERLDAEIAASTSEHVKAEQALSRAETSLLESTTDLSALETQFGELTATHTVVVAQLSAVEGHAPVAERADEIAGLLIKRSNLTHDLICAEKAFSSQSTEIDRLRSLIQSESDRLSERRGQRDSLVRQVTDHRNTLATIDERGLRARDTALARALELSRHAKTACGGYINANEALTKARAADAAATDAFRAASSRLDQAERDHATHSAARAEIGALADLADQTLSPEAIHLRSLLLPGEACPVCGSAEHPHVEADEALIGIVNQMRRRREALDDALRSAGSAMTGARGAIAQAKGEIAAASLAAQTAESDRHAAIDTYMALRPQLENALFQAGIDPQVPDQLDESVDASLDALVTGGEIARDATAGPLAEAERLRGEVDRLQSELDSHTSSIEDVGRVLGDHSSTLHDAEIAHAEHRATSIGLKDRLASITRELEPFLSAINLTSTDLDRDPEYVRHHMQQTGAAYLKLSAQQLDLERELQALVPRRASALSTHQGAMAAKAMAQVDLEERQASLRMKHEARAALLDCEATGSHRTRVNEARKAARTERHAAREAQATAATTAASAEAHAQAAISAVGAARERARAASAEFLSGCADLGLRAEQVRELLAVSDDVRGALRVRLDNLASALRFAETELATRRADLAALLEASSGEIDLGTMRETAATVAAEIGELQQRVGALGAEVQRDNEARGKAADVTAEIEAAAKDLAAWTVVDDVIGSATGDKFRRFAQGVTLDHLVHLANDQLAALSPRYQLARSSTTDLAVHVVDRDMGDEVRAARSLSGGERFLISLALALALSGLEGRQSFVDTLFIDEGFGSLDAETLDVAVDALESLQGRGRKVGVITHVAAMIDRIAVQVRVEKRGSGRSVVRVVDGITMWPATPASIH